MPDDRPVNTVERACDVLAAFARAKQADLGVTEIARDLELSKAVVHRILTTLVAKGLVVIDGDTRRYRLGPVVLALGVAYIDRLDLRQLALPRLRELSNATDETATLSIRYGWNRVYVDQVTPSREVKMSVALGHPFPLHAGSSSKAFLAFLEPEEQELYLAGGPLAPLTDRTITDAARLREELRATRVRGFAISSGERQDGAGSIAAPVFDHRSEPAGVISVCGPLERFRSELDAVTPRLLHATARLSAELGHRPDRPSEPQPSRQALPAR